MNSALSNVLRCVTVLAAAVATTTALRAQTGVLDQDSPVAGASIGLTPSFVTWQQQFVLGSAGYLEGVRLHLDGDAGAQVDFKLRMGGGWSTANTVFQKRVTKLANGLEALFVPVAGAVAGPAGTVAVFELTNASGSIAAWGSFVAQPGAPLYSQPLFLNGSSSCYSNCEWRIGFQSYLVTTPHVSSYCTSGVTTNGCAPSIAGIGTPSHTGAGSFVIQATAVEGQKQGLVFFGGTGPGHAPFGASSSSYACVRSPIYRTNVHNSGGLAGQCNGVLAVQWNAWIATHVVFPPPFPGQGYWAQAWFRDPAAPGSLNLSNGLFFVL